MQYKLISHYTPQKYVSVYLFNFECYLLILFIFCLLLDIPCCMTYFLMNQSYRWNIVVWKQTVWAKCFYFQMPIVNKNTNIILYVRRSSKTFLQPLINWFPKENIEEEDLKFKRRVNHLILHCYNCYHPANNSGSSFTTATTYNTTRFCGQHCRGVSMSASGWMCDGVWGWETKL